MSNEPSLLKRKRIAVTDGVRLWLAAINARACHLEDFRSAVQHRHDVVAVAHVGNAEDPGLRGNVEPYLGVQRIAVRRGAAVNPSGLSPSIVAAPTSVLEAKLGLERADLYLGSLDKSYRGRGNRKLSILTGSPGPNLTAER